MFTQPTIFPSMRHITFANLLMIFHTIKKNDSNYIFYISITIINLLIFPGVGRTNCQYSLARQTRTTMQALAVMGKHDSHLQCDKKKTKNVVVGHSHIHESNEENNDKDNYLSSNGYLVYNN